MMKSIRLAILVGTLLCTACTPTRFAGQYERTDYVYTNEAAGFRLTIPPPWLVYTQHQDFTVPLQLRPDQEQVLEAYEPAAKLGVVIVVQQGPLLAIDELVRRMQAVPEGRVTQHLRTPYATDFRQLALRTLIVKGRHVAEWIYTVRDTTAGSPVDITVSSYIVKVGERYVYLTFSVPAAQYGAAKPVITSLLNTLTLTSDA
jgi:hypothetical protein